MSRHHHHSKKHHHANPWGSPHHQCGVRVHPNGHVIHHRVPRGLRNVDGGVAYDRNCQTNTLNAPGYRFQ